MMNRSICAIAALGWTSCATTGTGAPPAAAPTLTDSIAAAARAHRPLVVEFGATWCTPCHEFADHVLPDPRVQAALRGVTFVQYDIDTPAGGDAMRRCKLTGVPAVVALDADGNVQRTSADLTIDAFLAFVGASQ